MVDHRDRGRQHRDDTSPSRVLALLPIAGGLLALSCTALATTIAGLAVAAAALLHFRPVLVPVALLAALAVTGMAVSGALALGAMALLSRLAQDYVEEEEN